MPICAPISAYTSPLLGGYDEPETLSYQINLNYPIGAEVRQSAANYYTALIPTKVKRLITVNSTLKRGTFRTAGPFREALKDKKIRACTPSRKQRKKPVKYDKCRFKQSNRIEIILGRLKDWRRVATRNDRRAKVLLSAIAFAVFVIYSL